MSDNADFAELGDMEVRGAASLFEQCEFIRDRATNSGLIIVQWANDVEWALRSVPVIEQRNGLLGDNPGKRARRVARHAYRAADAMRTVAEAAAKVRPAYLKTYQDVIQQRRNRTSFDPREGL